MMWPVIDALRPWRWCGAVAVVSALTLLPSAADGCSCSENPPCAGFWTADAVFIGVPTEIREESVNRGKRWVVTQITVDRVFRGHVSNQITMVPVALALLENAVLSVSSAGSADTISSSCDYGFEVGRPYFIYANRTKEGRFTTTGCAGTKPLDKAARDLAFIQSMPTTGSSGHVNGKVEREAFDPDDRSYIPEPVKGIAIALQGFYRRFRTETDANGRFDIAVPAGKYSVRAVVPETIKVYQPPDDISVPARGCAFPLSFTLKANGRVEGLLLREGGRGAADVSVELFAAELVTADDVPSDPRRSGNFSMTDANGYFRIDGVYPGRYRLGVNVSSGPSPESPYVSLFFPGVSAFSRARIIDVPLAPGRANVTMVLRSLPTMSASATVFGATGSPTAGAFVMISLPEYQGGVLSSGRTDDKGTFRFRTLRGLPYVVRVINPIGSVEPESKKYVAADTHRVEIVIGP
jgi:hypothetical protein